jgi:hypothetical protein
VSTCSGESIVPRFHDGRLLERGCMVAVTHIQLDVTPSRDSARALIAVQMKSVPN